MKYLILIAAFGASCVLSSVSSANIPSSVPEKNIDLEKNSLPLKADASVARSDDGWDSKGGSGWGAQETFSGPPAVFFALPIAVGLIILLWIAAYNTLRSPPPKIGFGAGAQGAGAGGWGQANYGWGVGPTAAGGWGAPAAATGGWAAAGSQVYPEYADLSGAQVGSESVASATSPQQAANVAAAVEQTVAGTGSRSFNDLTQRVLRSIEQ
jgi:hypothetical protein